MGNKGEQQSIYPPEIKLEAIRLHFEEGGNLGVLRHKKSSFLYY